jgi:beta-lactamase superfamily II metal-dependent hydrolase
MPPIRRLCIALLVATFALASASPAPAVTATGRLQVIHLDAGQGDAAVIISPLGEVAMVDNGTPSSTDMPTMGLTILQQLQALGVTTIKHHFASHYHSDHISNIDEIAGAGITIQNAWDRGGSYTSGAYSTYASTIGSVRHTLVKNQVITLDSLSAHPVTIKCVNLAGAGLYSGAEENVLSVVLKVSYGEFDEVFGGDLSGSTSGDYVDIETTVGPQVGPVEVYKVHHHGSLTSTNAAWLTATQPKIGVISLGDGNSYGHPKAATLTRLHNANVKTYWTETGAGVAPNSAYDRVSNGQVVISATWQGAGVDTVRGTGITPETFINSGTSSDPTPPVATLTSPDGGEVWKVGSTHAITWTATDEVGVTAVTLAYSGNGGASFLNPIATGIANTGTYNWTIPVANTTWAKVRVIAYDAAGNAGRDSSSATFTMNYCSIVASAGAGGGISPSGTTQLTSGGSQTYTITPAIGYQVADVLVDGSTVGAVTSYPFSNVTGDHTIAASFAVQTFTIAASAGTGGSITPSGPVTVNYGASQLFHIAPSVGYSLTGLMVDGGAVTPDTVYTFTNVTAAHSIAASFTIDDFALVVSVVGGGTVTKNPDLTVYPYGTSVTLDPAASEGWAFTGWSGDTSGTADPLTLVIRSGRAVTATFADVAEPVVNLTSPGGGERWTTTSLQSVTWSATDNVAVDSVTVEYSVTSADGPWLIVARGLENTGTVDWTLPSATADSAWVRVLAYDAAGNVGSDVSASALSIISSSAGVGDGGPATLALARPMPNPSRGETVLRFSLPQAGHARLEIVDVSGRSLWREDGDLEAGAHSLRWDGRGLRGEPAGAGLYFVRLTTPWGARTERLVRLQ